MEIREALEQVLNFVTKQEAKHEANVYALSYEKKWDEIGLEVERMGCYAEIRGFIDGMIEDLDNGLKMDFEKGLQKLLKFVKEEEEKNLERAYNYTQSENFKDAFISIDKMGRFSLVRVFIQKMMNNLERERD
jgi:hypothetical protein